jgi:hypothetical protein
MDLKLNKWKYINVQHISVVSDLWGLFGDKMEGRNERFEGE